MIETFLKARKGYFRLDGIRSIWQQVNFRNRSDKRVPCFFQLHFVGSWQSRCKSLTIYLPFPECSQCVLSINLNINSKLLRKNLGVCIGRRGVRGVLLITANNRLQAMVLHSFSWLRFSSDV